MGSTTCLDRPVFSAGQSLHNFRGGSASHFSQRLGRVTLRPGPVNWLLDAWLLGRFCQARLNGAIARVEGAPTRRLHG